MKFGVLLVYCLSILFSIGGCTKVSQEELNAKIDKCTEAHMEFTYMKDSAGNPYDVVCVRKHDNEK